MVKKLLAILLAVFLVASVVVPSVLGATDDTATTNEDNPVVIDVLANDGNPSLTVTGVTQGTLGSVAINTDNTLRYTPAANLSGNDSFTYTASDTTIGTVSVTVNPVNDAPMADDETVTTLEDTPAQNINVLLGDTDADGNTLTVTAVTQGARGAVVVNPDFTLNYSPQANFFGTDSFTYTVSDGNGGTDIGTVSVTITLLVDDAPIATADSYSTPQSTMLTVAAPGVLTNDVDPDTGNNVGLTVSVVTNVAHGTLSLSTNGGFTYTPTSGYLGSDSFTYIATAAGTTNPNSAPATVTLTITDSRSADEVDFDKYDDEYQEMEDDYYLLSRKYDRAEERNDLSDIEKYGDDLEDLRTDLENLDDDLQELEEDAEDRSDVDHDLLDDIDELQEDVNLLMDRIDRTLSGDEATDFFVSDYGTNPPASGVTNQQGATNQQQTGGVVYTQLSPDALSNTGTVPPQTEQTTSDTTALIWLVIGIVVVIAILGLLIALLVRR